MTYASSLVPLADARAPNEPRNSTSLSATRSRASSQDASASIPLRRINGLVRRSRWLTYSKPKRPLTHSMPWLDAFCGASSERASWSSDVTSSAMPQPTPQYGHVVFTRLTGSGRTFLAKMAPVGQAAKHEPHEVQIDWRSG